jgi:hydroxyacylglutathione hydrolase
MDIEIFATPGLGDTSYLIASDGEAALVDPQRDAWRFLAVAEERGWRVTQVLETHVHNDYLSGALEARATTGATIVAPERGGYAFAHRGADEGTDVAIGTLCLTAMATPGHTPEHLAWAVRQAAAVPEDPPDGVFTGGSLLVGSAGRTDLLGPARTEELTRLQATSLERLRALPPNVRILPTHGAGSFCSVGPAAPSAATTVGAELRTNAALRAAGSRGFHEIIVGGLGRYPDYYARMAPLNRAGPRVLGGPPTVAAVGPEAFATALARGVAVVDARPRAAFASGHLPGALNIELDDDFAAYVGWLVPFDAPIALAVADPPASTAAAAAMELVRIGYEHVVGYLDGGLDAWAQGGRPVRGYATTTVEELLNEVRAGGRPDILDVRQAGEWSDGLIPGSRTIFVADLPSRLAELPRDHEITVLCKSGGRASIAASVLDGAGIPVRLVARGGATGWTTRFAEAMEPR